MGFRVDFKKYMFLFAVLFFAGVLAPNRVFATAYSVTNNNDSGANSLRQAILDANSNPGPDTVDFAISGVGPHTIAIDTPLPDITDELTIDGTTQSGSSCEPRLLMIQVDYTNAWATGSSVVPMAISGHGADRSIIQGISFIGQDDGPLSSGTDDIGLSIINASDTVIRCNNFGLLGDGTPQSYNQLSAAGVNLMNNSNSNTIGGTALADRNIFSKSATGIDFECRPVGDLPIANEIYGNYFGTNVDGLVDANYTQNSIVDISLNCGDQNIVGGPSAGQRNIFYGANSSSIALVMAPGHFFDNSNNKIQGNYLGLDINGIAFPADATRPRPVGISLISITNAMFGNAGLSVHNNLIGGTAAGEGNVITGFGKGIVSFDITDASDSSRKNSFLGNSIYNNSDVGIELCNDDNLTDFTFQCDSGSSASTNDPLDTDIGANDLLNSPNIVKTLEVSGDTSIVTSTDVPAGDYRIEYFSNTAADSSGYGEGQTYLGYQNISATGGLEQWSVTLAGVAGATNVRATITEIDSSSMSGFGSTSEFGSIDSDGDGIVNVNDLDDDNDGIPDLSEDTDNDGDPTNDDADGDGTPNYLDLDSDNDGILDVVEAGHGATDADGDGMVDGDVGANGLANVVETSVDSGTINYTIQDFDGDGTPDYIDTDSDGDGVYDVVEAGGQDADNDGVLDSTTDTDNDGIIDLVDANNGGTALPVADTDGDGHPDYIDIDDDGDGIPTTAEDTDNDGDPTNDDADGDGTPNYLDLDSDNDGILDVVEAGHGATDADGDGMVDGDVGANGLANVVETSVDSGTINYTIQDFDGDGTPDYIDTDSDGDGVYDVVEAGGQDADNDGVLDSTTDTDNDGIIDLVDANNGGTALPVADTDGDGHPDYIDIDDDGDGIPTTAEDTDNDGDPTNDDADGDGTPNYLDLDSDNDGILDVVEAGHGATDANGDGMVDGDVGANGLANVVETSADSGTIDYTIRDFDGDGTPDYLDTDSDGDGVYDVVEAGGQDADNDGVLDSTTDTDNDGIIDLVDANNGGTALPVADTDGDGHPDYIDIDDDGDGIPTTAEDTDNDGDPTNDDADGDGTPNYLDLDSDNDGILDVVEAGHGATDANGDGMVDGDVGANGLANVVETSADSGTIDYTIRDFDGDGTPDYLDTDSDGDGVYDVVEAGGQDADNDGVLDSTTDTDNDGIIDLVDANNGGTALPVADTDGDGHPDYIDIDDDGDGIPTANEDTDNDGDPTNDDINGDGTPNYLDLDSDGDGVKDIVEAGGTDTDNNGLVDSAIDTDGDGLADTFDPDNGGTPLPLTNTDGDSNANPYDIDDDNDGILTTDEDTNGDGNPANDDVDGDGTPNYLDLDSDGDGVSDKDEVAAGTDPYAVSKTTTPSDLSTTGENVTNYYAMVIGLILTAAFVYRSKAKV
jgi:hypothetical protein